MEREQKRTEVTQLNKMFSMAKSVVILGFTKLTADNDTYFRKQVRESNAKYRVAKNTLLKLAAKDTNYCALSKHFNNVTAVATTENDVVSMVKAVNDFLKKNPHANFKGAILDGKEITLDEFKIIAELPSREVLIGKLLYLMNYPIAGIAVALNAVCKQKEDAA